MNIVKDSPLGGRGVFARQPYGEGAVVETCAYDTVWEWRGLEDKVFGGPCEHTALILFGNGMLYNHSADNNVEYATVGPAIVFTATRAVKEGEELTLDYGREWWESRPRLKQESPSEAADA